MVNCSIELLKSLAETSNFWSLPDGLSVGILIVINQDRKGIIFYFEEFIAFRCGIVKVLGCHKSPHSVGDLR